MQEKLTGSIKYTINLGQFLKVIFYTLQNSHSLTVFILYHCILFERFCRYSHFGKRTNSANPFILPVKNLPFTNHNFQLRIESGEKAGHHILKAVKNRECTDQRQCSKGHSAHRNAGYDINSIMFLFRKKITPGYIEGEIHLCNELFHFSNESIFSI